MASVGEPMGICAGNVAAVSELDRRWRELLASAMVRGWWGEVRVKVAFQDGVLQLESFDGHADRRIVAAELSQKHRAS